MAEEAGPHLFGPERAIWLDRLDVRRAEVHAGIEWGLAHPAGIDESLRCLAEVSQLRGDTAEAIARYRQAMALLRDAAEGALARQTQVAPDALVAAADEWPRLG